jgi:adenylate cyclase
VITITGIRDHLQPEWLITITGIRSTASTLLDTYVGHDAGERILAGHIRRGDIEEIHAAI